jgi:hypothetical protein
VVSSLHAARVVHVLIGVDVLTACRSPYFRFFAENSPLSTWFCIPEGFYALVSRYGAVIPFPETGHITWPAGLHYGPPWLRVAYLVTKQHIVFDAPVKGCLSKDNVTVQIDVAVVLRLRGDVAKGEDPDLVKKFVFNVTPRGLQNQLSNAVEEAVRALARSMNHTEVYGLRSVVVDSASSLASAPSIADAKDRTASLLDQDPDNPLHEGLEMGKLQRHTQLNIVDFLLPKRVSPMCAAVRLWLACSWWQGGGGGRGVRRL